MKHTLMSVIAMIILAGCGATMRSSVIEDAEDNNNRILASKGRGGIWFTFADKEGSTITPTDGSSFTMSPGGASGSRYAARINGRTGNGAAVYVGGGFNFAEPKSLYDASACKGISFHAKGGADAVTDVRFKVSDIDTDPAGKVCGKNGTEEGCYNDFGQMLKLTTEWQLFTILFADMQQAESQPSFPRPESIKPDRLFGLVWEVNARDSIYDIWIDDIRFVGCR